MQRLLLTLFLVSFRLSASTIDYDAYAQYDLSRMQENDQELQDFKNSGVPIAKHQLNQGQILCDAYNGCSLDTDAGLIASYQDLGSQFSLLLWAFLVHTQQGPLVAISDNQSKQMLIVVENSSIKLEYWQTSGSVTSSSSIAKPESNTWCAVYFQKEQGINKFGIYFSKEIFEHGSLQQQVELETPLKLLLSIDNENNSLFTVIKELRIYNQDFKVPKLIQKIATNQCPAILNYNNKLGCGDQSDSMYMDFNFDKSRGGYSVDQTEQKFYSVVAYGKEGHGWGSNGHYYFRNDSADCTFDYETGYAVMPHQSLIKTQNCTEPILNKVGLTLRTQMSGNQIRYDVRYSSYFFVGDAENLGFELMGKDEQNFLVKAVQNGKVKYFETFTIDSQYFLDNSEDFSLMTATFLKRKNSGLLTFTFNNFIKTWDEPTFINVNYQGGLKPRGVGLYQMFRGQKTKYLELNRRLMGVFEKTANMTNLCPQGTILDAAGLNCINCPANCEVCDRDNIDVCLFPPSLICDYNCETCTGPSSTECLSCSGGRILQNNQCLDCHASCKTCEGLTSNCTSCPRQDDILFDGQCLSECPQGTYKHNQTCSACDGNCKNCNGSGPYHCTECQRDKVLYNAQCLSQCPRTTFAQANQCQECPTRAQILTKDQLNSMLQVCVFPAQNPEGNQAIEAAVLQNYSILKDDLVLLQNFTSNAAIQQRSSNISVIAQNALLSFHKRNFLLQTELFSLQRKQLTDEMEFSLNANSNFQRVKMIFPQEITLHSDITVLFCVWKFGLYSNTLSSDIQAPVIGVSIEAYDQVRAVSNLFTPIQLIFKQEEALKKVNATGLFWNADSNTWSSEEMNTRALNGQIILQTHHLTDFTFKLDPIPPPISPPEVIIPIGPDTPNQGCQTGLSFRLMLTGMVIIMMISIWNDCYPENYPHNRQRLSRRKTIEELFPYVVIYNMPLINICAYRDDVYLSIFRAALFTAHFWLMVILHSSYVYDLISNDAITQTVLAVVCLILFSPSAVLYKCLIKKKLKVDESATSQREFKSDLIHREIRQNTAACFFTYVCFCWLTSIYLIFFHGCFSSHIELLKLSFTGLVLLFLFTIKLWIQSIILLKCWKCMRCRCCVLLLSDVFTKRVLTDKSQLSQAQEITPEEAETEEEDEDLSNISE